SRDAAGHRGGRHDLGRLDRHPPAGESLMIAHAILAAALGALALGLTACVPQQGGDCNDYPHCGSWKIDPADYVKNPAVTTKHEYWAVAKDGPKAYLFPRPDGFRTIAAECHANGPDADLFLRNSLCEPATSEALLARVNGMGLDDA